ncbi:MAG: alpha/beta hydrolase [Bacteroidetes bacterium]|nr:alpha/beta hydrolase [Bacteroidota bacterium]MCH8525120.1 alpha/beta hydrolase [Balneolales bacterium]
MNRRILAYTVILALLTALLALASLYGYFLHWRSQTDIKLPGNAAIANLSKGALEYRLEGDGNQTILLLHGTPGTHSHMTPEVFTQAGYRVLIVSRPGYARSSLDVGRTPQEQADAYAELLTYLGIHNVFVLGISGGGPSALQFAKRHPDKTAVLVMYGAVSMAIEFAAPRLADRITNTEFGLWIAFQWVSRRDRNPYNRRIASLYLKSLFPVHTVQDGLENDLINMSELPVYDLSKIMAPTLVMHGTEDRIVLFSHGHFVASSIPNAELIRLENDTHDGLVKNFDEDMKRAIAWFEDLP